MNKYYVINNRTGEVIDEIAAACKFDAFINADAIGYNLNKVDIVEA